MQVLAAVVLGIAAGIFIKAVFARGSSTTWSVVLGAAGGLVAYLASTTLSEQVYGYMAILGIAVVAAGIFAGILGKFGVRA